LLLSNKRHGDLVTVEWSEKVQETLQFANIDQELDSDKGLIAQGFNAQL
jgi:tRNA A37 threonylcarbamoyladenosine biosynthesis protein TsaE